MARDPDQKSLDQERQRVWSFVNISHGRSTVCTTFDPFLYREPSFKKATISEIDRDFNRGAPALKIWKNIGEQVKDPKGDYLMPDNPVFEPIYKEISDRNKTLIAHLADPDSIWDMIAAQRARALGVGLLSGGYGEEELARAGAFRVYADPADLLNHIDEVAARS